MVVTLVVECVLSGKAEAGLQLAGPGPREFNVQTTGSVGNRS